MKTRHKKTQVELRRNTSIKFLIIDGTESRELVYLRADKNDQIFAQAILLEHDGEYIRILDDKDIYTKQDAHPLQNYIEELGNGDVALFDEFLMRQMIKPV